jgi:magnesium transporter
VADALDEIHVPKIDDWGDYLYLVVRGPKPQPTGGDRLKTEELDIFFGINFIITFHDSKMPSLDRTWRRFQETERISTSSSSELLYNLIDEIASDFMQLADTIGESLNDIEDEIFGDPEPSVLEKIFSQKRDLLLLRRILAPQREVVNKLARGDFKIVQENSKIYFRDLYDHFLRLYDILENLRDLTGSSLEIYLSVVNNRTNGIMRVLTLITTLFMPISFLVGFFGMNYFQPVAEMTTWTDTISFQILIAALVVVPIIMYLTIRKKGWI